jgi:hypothetical protein
VSFHLVMNHSFPLYRSAILQSPGYSLYPTHAGMVLLYNTRSCHSSTRSSTICGTEALSIANHYASRYNCQNSNLATQVDCLRKVDAATLISCPYCNSITNIFIPFIDNKQITDQLPILFSKGKYNKVGIRQSVSQSVNQPTSN